VHTPLASAFLYIMHRLTIALKTDLERVAKGAVNFLKSASLLLSMSTGAKNVPCLWTCSRGVRLALVRAQRCLLCHKAATYHYHACITQMCESQYTRTYSPLMGKPLTGVGREKFSKNLFVLPFNKDLSNDNTSSHIPS
jgi:hypothetical protein